MSEYFDAKQRSYKITETVVAHDNRAEAEEDIVAELYKIFRK